MEELSKQNNLPDADTDDEEVINWVDEANAIINDVKHHVEEIQISNQLPNSSSNIYINLRTLEGNSYCINMSSSGFRIVGTTYDTIAAPEESKENAEEKPEDDIVFETPYALLDKISPAYKDSFANKLCKMLRQLQQMRLEFNEEDEEEFDSSSLVVSPVDVVETEVRDK